PTPAAGRSASARTGRGARRAARGQRLRRGARLDGGDDRGGRARLRDGRRGEPRDERPRGPRDRRSAGRRDARHARRDAARMGAPSARPPSRDADLRTGPDGVLLPARGRRGDPDLPVRGTRRGGARAAAGPSPRALPRARDRGRPLASVPASQRGRVRAGRGTDRRLRRGRRMGRDRSAQAGEVDARDAPAPAGAAAGRRRGGVRLPRRARLAGAALDAALGPRVALPALARAATAVAALRALQPALRGGLRGPVRAPPDAALIDGSARGPERAPSGRRNPAGPGGFHGSADNLSYSMSAQQSNADVAVVGLGRVGLPLALSFAQRGLRVIGVDNDARRLDAVREGRMPFAETGAQEVLEEVHRGDRLSLSSAVADAASARQIVITLGTPSFSHIEIDMRDIRSALDDLLG